VLEDASSISFLRMDNCQYISRVEQEEAVCEFLSINLEKLTELNLVDQLHEKSNLKVATKMSMTPSSRVASDPIALLELFASSNTSGSKSSTS